MSSININEDLRIIKTKRALCIAMSSLLENHSFRKITIKEICEEALISRATFYSHFIDKNDLLKHWIAELLSKISSSSETYEEMEKAVNSYVYENTVTLKNLVCDADEALYNILYNFILSTINLSTEKIDNEGLYNKNVVLSNFYAGGMIAYLLWQIDNQFPSDVPPMNRYLCEMIYELHAWQSK